MGCKAQASSSDLSRGPQVAASFPGGRQLRDYGDTDSGSTADSPMGGRRTFGRTGQVEREHSWATPHGAVLRAPIVTGEHAIAPVMAHCCAGAFPRPRAAEPVFQAYGLRGPLAGYWRIGDR